MCEIPTIYLRRSLHYAFKQKGSMFTHEIWEPVKLQPHLLLSCIHIVCMYSGQRTVYYVNTRLWLQCTRPVCVLCWFVMADIQWDVLITVHMFPSLIRWKIVLLEKLIIAKLAMKFSDTIFIFSRVHNSQTNSIHSSRLVSLSFTLILSWLPLLSTLFSHIFNFLFIL
jgi:hypothetical protein